MIEWICVYVCVLLFELNNWIKFYNNRKRERERAREEKNGLNFIYVRLCVVATIFFFFCTFTETLIFVHVRVVC